MAKETGSNVKLVDYLDWWKVRLQKVVERVAPITEEEEKTANYCIDPEKINLTGLGMTAKAAAHVVELQAKLTGELRPDSGTQINAGVSVSFVLPARVSKGDDTPPLSGRDSGLALPPPAVQLLASPAVQQQIGQPATGQPANLETPETLETPSLEDVRQTLRPLVTPSHRDGRTIEVSPVIDPES
jgi:hypothetical protein